MLNLLNISCFIMLIFSLIAAFDGLYFHLYKYRLYERKSSQKEHVLHTINSFIFPFSIFLLFVINSSGLLLWLIVLLIIITLVVEFLDVFEERQSRMSLGGLTSTEYATHFSMSMLRATFTTLVLVEKPNEAWSLSAQLMLQHYETHIIFIGYVVSILGIPIFILHFYLYLKAKKIKYKNSVVQV